MRNALILVTGLLLMGCGSLPETGTLDGEGETICDCADTSALEDRINQLESDLLAYNELAIEAYNVAYESKSLAEFNAEAIEAINDTEFDSRIGYLEILAYGEDSIDIPCNALNGFQIDATRLYAVYIHNNVNGWYQGFYMTNGYNQIVGSCNGDTETARIVYYSYPN